MAVLLPALISELDGRRATGTDQIAAEPGQLSA
jgi:hypothetical protein